MVLYPFISGCGLRILISYTIFTFLNVVVYLLPITNLQLVLVLVLVLGMVLVLVLVLELELELEPRLREAL